MGGPVEVRKQRALERHRVRSELDKSVRVMINGVRMLLASNSSWSSQGGAMSPWPTSNEFDEAVDEAHEAYVSVRPLMSGHDGSADEELVGDAMVAAGTAMTRVKDFRDQAVGNADAGFRTHQTDMQEDLATAERVLVRARDFLRSSRLSRWSKRRGLDTSLQDLKKLGDQLKFPRTPISYARALQNVKVADGNSATDRRA
jgi:hypothetical protein